jgi:threonylcarbamoyladenosine tRNA methylthiotransferase MtaB
MRYAVITFGCRVNQADSLGLEAELRARGAIAVPADRAEFVIVNTCSVTASADQGARQVIRRLARENPAARIIATGCYATRCAGEVAALPGVVAVIPNESKQAGRWLAVLTGHREGQAGDGPCGQTLAPGLMGRTAWTLRAQTGCEESCSYCIIPSTRGASRSRSLDEIHQEVARVVAAGYREIVVTGVHLGSYGRDLRPRRTLADLLDRFTAMDLPSLGAPAGADARLLVRLSSLEPMDCTDEVIELVTDRSSGTEPTPGVFIAPHFHLPLQHASDGLLQRMRRPYSLAQYAALVSGIRRRLPHAAIGSDILVGFPGESDDDFRTLEDYLIGSPLTHLHVFPYSERPDTDAASYAGKVHGTTVKHRAARIREISRDLQAEFRDRLRSTRRPALTIDDGALAMTDNYVRVPVGPGHIQNEWVMVTL